LSLKSFLGCNATAREYSAFRPIALSIPADTTSILRNIPLPNISGATPFGKSRILLEGGKPLYRMGSPTK
jgi:hypothetical protein